MPTTTYQPNLRKLALSMSDDELINPVKELRLQLRFTPETLSREANVNIASVTQQEDGLYPNPLPSLLLTLGIRPGTKEEDELIERYHAYQVLKRQSNGPARNSSRLTLVPNFRTDEHPLLTWRKQSGISTYGFCSAFCIHMPSVNNFEKNIIKLTENPPKNIMLPLIQAGFNLVDGLLDEFSEACVLYKASLLNRIRSANNLPLITVS